MTEVYKFKVKLRELEDKIWRDIEISSASSLAKLGYAVLAAFEAEGSHLFCINYKGCRYEIVYDDFYDDFEIKTVDPISKKLSSLKLQISDKMEMEYDYGAGWGIIEGLSAPEWVDYIKQTDETGVMPTYYDIFDKEVTCDYRRFNLKTINSLLKGYIQHMKENYEEY